MIRTLLFFLVLLSVNSLYAEDVDPQLDELIQKKESLVFKTGEINIGSNLAVIDLSEEYKYLDSSNTSVVLEEIWNNPPNETLGMIVPKDFDAFSSEAWGIIITYVEDGYIKDDDAGKIDYSEMLENMKKETEEYNPDRIKAGYGSIQIVGWA